MPYDTSAMPVCSSGIVMGVYLYWPMAEQKGPYLQQVHLLIDQCMKNDFFYVSLKQGCDFTFFLVFYIKSFFELHAFKKLPLSEWTI